MEAWDPGSKIRPIPIDDLDTDTPQQGPVEPKRRWAPLVVIVVGAIAFGIIATGLGSGDPEVVSSGATTPAAVATTPPAITTTTWTPPAPQPLRDVLPVAANGLRVVVLGPSSARIGNWMADDLAPSFGHTVAAPRGASFNSDGSRLAVLSAAAGSSYVLSNADGGDTMRIPDAVSGAWHATDPDLLAWTVVDGDGTIVAVADVSGASNGLTPLLDFRLPGHQELAAWGDWGFATTDENMTYGWDPDGVATRATAGTFFDASADGTLLIANLDDSGAMPFLLSPEGIATTLPSLEIWAADLQLSDNGEWVFATTLQQDGPTTILARAVNSRSARITSIAEAAAVLGTAADDRFIVLQELDSRDVVFKDWNSGIEYRVPFTDELGSFYMPGPSY
jgi:hypothetical protein